MVTLQSQPAAYRWVGCGVRFQRIQQGQEQRRCRVWRKGRRCVVVIGILVPSILALACSDACMYRRVRQRRPRRIRRWGRGRVRARRACFLTNAQTQLYSGSISELEICCCAEKAKFSSWGFPGHGAVVFVGRPAGSGEGKRHAHHERSLVRMRTPRFYCGTVLQAISHCQSSTRGPSHEVLLRRKVQSRPNRPGRCRWFWFC